MEPAEAAAHIGRWRPSSVSPQAAAFARDVIGQVAPEGRERAKNLLWAAGRLADYAASLGLDLIPEVVFHPSVTERFARGMPGLSGVARRTLRTNQRFIARRVVPHLYPAGVPLPRERARQPYSPAEISGFLALADAQPTCGRRMRAAGLACLGAGAGLIRGDLREARGTDVACRSGGVIVSVRGARPRTVPVLARYHSRLLAAARFAGGALVCGGTDPGRRNLTSPLIRCPLRPASMPPDRDRPQILTPPENPPACCTQQTITVPADVAGQDQAETRLPVKSPPPLLRPPHRRRTRLRHRQRPRRQQHHPRPVPPDGPGPAHAARHDAADRPQPAHPGSLERPAGRKPASRRQRPAPENPAPPPQDPRHARHRRAAPAPGRAHHGPRSSPARSLPGGGSMPGNHPGHAQSHQLATQRNQNGRGHARARPRTRMSDPNVKIGPTKT
jgi:hypothetical protein